METIKEFFQNIYDSSTERIKSPLVGSFIISFLIFNWRVFAILFYSEWPVHCRIEWIEDNYCKWPNLLIPIGIALFYIVPLPYINLIIDFLLGKYSKKRAEEKKAKRTGDLHQERDYAALERQVADAKAGTSEINNLQARIESLQQEIKDLTELNKLDHQRWLERGDLALEKENELIKLNQQKDKEIIALKSSITETIHKYENKDELDFVLDPDVNFTIQRTLPKLTEDERNTLKTMFGNGKEHKAFPMLSVHPDNLNRFIDLGIVNLNNQLVTLTRLGRFILIYIQITVKKM
ncbi:septum formation initiator family protein [Flavobacterium piscisymbiosum]|uniref:Septum formation initiator family protein n=1 Tax=Flavobacterium piscisymbiosum TaxID=2893753 RepID=A0ABS8MLD6_9FLAO|nr:septum formation initiator family protein [Flavobacterium sp. F-30]MCC9066306.1 septum formation initiator family protein [Flavobacterium sp. F-30]